MMAAGILRGCLTNHLYELGKKAAGMFCDDLVNGGVLVAMAYGGVLKLFKF